MQRLHLHLGVKNLNESINFYKNLFKSEPTKVKSDYAQWILEDPKINFAISTRVSTPLRCPNENGRLFCLAHLLLPSIMIATVFTDTTKL